MNRLNVIITNTSRHADKLVRFLVEYAARNVRAVADREGWAGDFDSNRLCVRVTHSSHAYCGRFLGRSRLWAIRKSYRVNAPGVSDSLPCWNVLLRIGQASHFPMNTTYPRFQDMPEERAADWVEGLIHLAAHEFAHIRYSGRRDGEFNCELIASDCMTAFRLDRPLFERFVAAGVRREDERATAIAAKSSPDAVKAAKLAKAEADLKRWTRKHKLAATKIKKLNRRLAGLRKAKA